MQLAVVIVVRHKIYDIDSGIKLQTVVISNINEHFVTVLAVDYFVFYDAVYRRSLWQLVVGC